MSEVTAIASLQRYLYPVDEGVMGEHALGETLPELADRLVPIGVRDAQAVLGALLMRGGEGAFRGRGTARVPCHGPEYRCRAPKAQGAPTAVRNPGLQWSVLADH